MVRVCKSEEEFSDLISPLPVLASEKYLLSKSKNYGWFVSEDFILPFIIDKKLIFKRMIFTHDTIYLKKDVDVKDEKKFLDEMVEITKKENLCDFINKAQSYTVFKTYPSKSIHVPWGTYEIDTTASEEDILAAFNQSHRRALRKAIKEGVTVKFNIDPKETYELIHETVSRAGSLACPPYEYFKQSAENLGKNCLYAGAYKDGVLQTVLTVLFDDKRAYELYGGNIVNSHKGSGQLLKYEAIKYVKTHSKAPIFDLCGARINVKQDSKYAAIQQYKERYRPTLIEGYAFKVIINPLKTKLFNILVQLYSKKQGTTYVDPIDQLLNGNYS